MPLDLEIAIPAPNTTAFERGFAKVNRILDITSRKLTLIDKQIQRTGLGAGGRTGQPGTVGRNVPGRSGGRSTRRGGGSAFGGNSGAAANILRAGGLGGSLATAAGAGIGAGSLIALTLALTSATKASADFEEQLAEIGRVAGFTDKQLADFGATVRGLATNIPVGTATINALASAGANAGLRADELQAFVSSMTDLAFILPNITEEQTRGITRIASLTGFPITRIDELNGAIVNLQQNSRATLPQLIKLGQRVAQDAGIFGISAEEVLGLASTIADLGLQPERASTAIGRLIGRLKNLDRESREVTENILSTFKADVDFEAFQRLSRENPVEVLRLIGEESVNFNKVLSELQITGKQAVLSEALLQNIDTFNRLLDEADPNASIIKDQTLDKLELFNSQLKLTGNLLSEISRQTIGDPLREAGTEALKNINFGLKQLILPDEVENAIEEEANKVRILQNRIIKDAAKRLQEFGDVRTESAREFIKKTESELRQLREGFFNEFRNDSKETSEDVEAKFGFFGLFGTLVDQFNKDVDISIATLQEVANRRLFGSFSDELRIDEQIKDAADASRQLAANLGKSKEELDALRDDSLTLEVQLREFDLSAIEKEFNAINREIDKLVDATKDTPAFTKNLQNEAKRIAEAAGVEINFEDGIENVAKQIEDALRNGGEQTLRDVLKITDTLQNNIDQVNELEKQRSIRQQLLLQEQLKDLEKEAEKAARETAPSVAAIEDAGSAVELLNRQILDQQVQEEQLEALEGIREAVEADLELARENKLKVLTAPTGR